MLLTLVMNLTVSVVENITRLPLLSFLLCSHIFLSLSTIANEEEERSPGIYRHPPQAISLLQQVESSLLDHHSFRLDNIGFTHLWLSWMENPTMPGAQANIVRYGHVSLVFLLPGRTTRDQISYFVGAYGKSFSLEYTAAHAMDHHELLDGVAQEENHNHIRTVVELPTACDPIPTTREMAISAQLTVLPYHCTVYL